MNLLCAVNVCVKILEPGRARSTLASGGRACQPRASGVLDLDVSPRVRTLWELSREATNF